MTLSDLLLEQDILEITFTGKYENNLDENILDIPVRGNVTFVKDDDTIGWSKCLKHLPIFTVRNIEEHRKLSGKAKGLSVMKTLQRVCSK